MTTNNKNEINITKRIEEDYEWAKRIELSILKENKVIGWTNIWSFNIESIKNNIAEDYTFYMDEDTHMREKTAEFILNTINNRDCIYIDEIFVNKEYRGDGVGTYAINTIKNMYKNNYIVLYASALDPDDKNIFINSDTDNAKKFLKKLDRFYKKLDFKNNGEIYYLD